MRSDITQSVRLPKILKSIRAIRQQPLVIMNLIRVLFSYALSLTASILCGQLRKANRIALTFSYPIVAKC